MSKAIEYNNKIINKRRNIYKDKVVKYFNKECSYEELNKEKSKLFDDYRNLEKIINEELKINK